MFSAGLPARDNARVQISLIVHDLASNPIVRAVPLARALQSAGHDVHLVGALLSGDQVYAPYRDLFPTTAVRASRDTTKFLPLVPQLARLLTGEVIVACKPLVTTLLPALVATRAQRRRPLVLDVEDDEFVGLGRDLRGVVWRDVIKGWRHVTAAKYTWGLHPFSLLADAVVVSSRALQQRHGGTVLRHGPDEDLYAPDRSELLNEAACRARFGLPVSAPIALFAGVSQSHKGLPVLIDALASDECREWHLALAGPEQQPDFQSASERLGGRCHLLGLRPYADMPQLLAAATAIALPQRDTQFARAQIPAKLIEAMAMRRPVVATSVGDLPEILDCGASGWLVPPDDPVALAAALAAIDRDPCDARRRAEAAREWFLDNASTAAMARTLDRIVQQLTKE